MVSSGQGHAHPEPPPSQQLVARHRGATTSFDLENAEDLFQLQDARLALEPLRGLIVLDEVQRRTRAPVSA